MRLIDADALQQAHCEDCNAEVQEICKQDPICAMMMWVKDAPTIDAEPVVHAHWVDDVEDDIVLKKCSVCGGISAREYPYCRECGAKMDEVIE